jgi:2-dehydropantoate 2-reductase
MKILIYGAGAVGSDLGGMLSLTGEKVTLLARGAQLLALRTYGLRVFRPHQTEQTIAVDAVGVQEAGGNYDLIVVTLKSMQLADVAQDLVDRLAPQGILLMVQNGLPWWYFEHHPCPWGGSARIHSLDPQNILSKTIPLDRIVGAVIYRPVIQLAPGQIHLPQSIPPKLILGEIDNCVTERLSVIRSLFERSGVCVEITQNIRLAKWQKLMVNLIWNPLCAITLSSPGHIVENPDAIAFVRQLIAEGRSVAYRMNMIVDIDEDREIENARGKFHLQPSMLQDVRSGKPLEVDAILHAVVELAQEIEVPIPAITQLACFMEMLNQSILRKIR